MKRKPLIAAVLAGLAGLAHADETINIGKASVSVYGVADIFVGHFEGKNVANAGTATQSDNTTQLTGLGTGGRTGSRLGFKGEMPVNDDLAAVFKIELGNLVLNDTTTNSTVGNGLTKTRTSYVGVSSKSLGTLTIGRHQSPSFDWSADMDPAGGMLSPLGDVESDAGVGINPSDRINSSIQWVSPSWNGFTAKANIGFPKGSNFSLDDGTPANHSQTITQASLSYGNGPVFVSGVVRIQGNTRGVCGTAANAAVATKCSTAGAQPFEDGAREWGLGGTYDFRVVKLFASTQDHRNNATLIHTKINNIGAQVPVFTQGTVALSFAEGKRQTALGTAKEDSFTAVYIHQLNKYARAYVGYLDTKNRDPANPLGNIFVTSTWTNTPALASPNTNTSASIKGLALGMILTF